MKLFVWSDPYKISYGSTLLFAIAESVEEARLIAATAPAYAYGEFKDNNPGATLGEPLRIVDLPCAEWHKWQE